MIRRAGLLAALLLAVALAPPAPAAGPAANPHASLPDVPAGPATVRGRVLHADSGAPIAGAPVMLYALPNSGNPGVRRTKTDASGRFVFSKISNDPNTTYLVGTEYRGLPYPGERVQFKAGETSHSVEIRVAEPSADVSPVRVTESRLRIDWVGDHLAVTETHELKNGGKYTIYVPPHSRRGHRPAFRARLPAGAKDFVMPFGVTPEGVVHHGDRLTFYGPVYPGTQELSFSYTLPVKPGRSQLDKVFPSGAARFVVRVSKDGLKVKAAGLSSGKSTTVEGRSYRQLVGSRLAPGARVALHLDVPPLRVGTKGIRETETQLFLELDDAALLVHEEHHVEVPGKAQLVAPSGGRLLRFTVPATARDVRFGTGAVDMGLAPDGKYAVALRGPVPPGDSTVEIVYRVPVDGGHIRLTRRFGSALPLLSVYVADNGVIANSPRLHERRPVRSQDRTFLHLEGFQIKAGEPVELDLASLPPITGLPQSVVFGLVAFAALLCIGALTGPLWRSEPAAEGTSAEPEDAARSERDALYASLRDLEDDFETGKIAEDDYGVLRKELRTRALALLRRERQATTEAEEERSQKHAGPPSCGRCGATSREGDRFCAQCGTALASSGAREHEASA